MAVFETSQVVHRWNSVTNQKPLNPQHGDTWFDGKIKKWFNADSGDWLEEDLTGPPGEAGEQGIGVQSTSVTYQSSTSGTITPTGTWTTSIPSVSPSQYLWTRTILTFDDNSSSTSYSIGRMGDDGVSVSNIQEQYYLSTSPTALFGGSWQNTVPIWQNGKYIWTRSRIEYSDSKVDFTNPINSTGADGQWGKDGLGVTSVDVLYYQSTSATSLVGGSWVTTSPAWVDGRFIWSKTKTTFTDNTSRETAPVNITGGKGATGADGKTTYFYTGWADSLDGRTGFTINPAQSGTKGYMGTYSSQSATQSTNPSSYAWTKLAGAFEEELNKLKSDISAVPKVVTQPTAPNPEPNMQWWQTDPLDDKKILIMHKWDSVRERWDEQSIDQAVLNIVELNAVNINGSVITGSSFLNYWEKPANGRVGITRIEQGILRSNYTVSTGGTGGMQLDEGELFFETKKPNGTVDTSMRVSPQRLQIFDSSQPYGIVSMEYKDLMLVPPTALTPSSGFAQYTTSGVNLPTASRSMGRSIQLSGAFKNNNQLDSNASGVMCILPVWARPKEQVNFRLQGSGINTFLLVIRTNGELELSRYGASGYVAIPAGSWFNISCGFTAAN